MATTTSLNSVLKTKYSARIEYQLNDEQNLLNLFQNAVWDWYGLEIHIPIHIGRNGGVQAIPFGGNYPTAGDQNYNNLIVTAALLTGSIFIPRSEMKRAKEKGYGAFISWWDASFKRTMVDVKFRANRYLISGNRFKGFLDQRLAGSPQTGTATVGAPLAGTDTYNYFGDLSPFDGTDENSTAVVAATDTTWVRIRVFRMDTYAEVTPTAGSNAANFCSGFDATARTINISTVSARGLGGGDLLATLIAGMPVGIPMAVALHPVQYVLTAGGNFGTVSTHANQPQGIFGNLCEPTHFGVNRTTATGTATVLQSDALLTQNIAPAGGRAAVTPARVQHVMDRCFTDGGEEVDCILISPLTRAAYLAIMTGTIETQAHAAGGKGDASYSKLAFAGMQLKVSQHVPAGGWIFLKKSTWKLAQLSKCEFVDDDGAIIHRVSGTSAFEAAIEWYYNFVCLKPRSNGILVGTNLA